MALEEVLWRDLNKLPSVKKLRLILETASRFGSSLPKAEGLEPLVRANCESELQPPGANTGTQLPRKKYIFMAVSVDAMPVKNRMAVWQVRLSIT